MTTSRTRRRRTSQARYTAFLVIAVLALVTADAVMNFGDLALALVAAAGVITGFGPGFLFGRASVRPARRRRRRP